jgi:hypothetical protein
MKKKLVIVSIFLLLLGITACGESDEKKVETSEDLAQIKSNLAYDEVSVSVIQSVAIPGGKYSPLDNASIPVAKLKKGKFNLKYDFTLKAEDDNEKAVIAMSIEFPDGVTVTELTSSGIVGKNPDQNTYYIAQHKDGTGSLEFKVEIPSDLYDETLPIDFSFNYYDLGVNTLRAVLGGAVGVVSGIVAGVVTGNPSTGVAVGAGAAAALAGGSIALDKLEGVTPKYLKESKKRFAITAYN